MAAGLSRPGFLQTQEVGPTCRVRIQSLTLSADGSLARGGLGSSQTKGQARNESSPVSFIIVSFAVCSHTEGHSLGVGGNIYQGTRNKAECEGYKCLARQSVNADAPNTRIGAGSQGNLSWHCASFATPAATLRGATSSRSCGTNTSWEYATVGVSWEGPSDAPWDYISRAEEALACFEQAVSWSDLASYLKSGEADGIEQASGDNDDAGIES